MFATTYRIDEDVKLKIAIVKTFLGMNANALVNEVLSIGLDEVVAAIANDPTIRNCTINKLSITEALKEFKDVDSVPKNLDSIL